MKLQGIAAAHPAMAQPLAEQAPAGEPSAQAAGQASQRDAALREALPSRQAGDGESRAKRTGTSFLRSIANTSQGGSAHGSPRMQTMVVRQSDDMQIQDDGSDDAIALPDELDGAIADWASTAVGNANNESDADVEVRERPSHLRVTRDGQRQQQRGQQQPQQQSQQQGEQEPSTRVAERRDRKQAAQPGTDDGLADPTQASGQPPPADLASESPWSLHPGARSTARIAPIAAAAPAQRQVAELDSRLSAHAANSDTVSALMWALAAMVVAIIATLLVTVFSAQETATDTDTAPGSHEATHRDERRTR